MKKILPFVILLAVCPPALPATSLLPVDGKNIGVKATEVVRAGNDTVSVAFRIEVGDNVTAPNRSLVIRPFLRGINGQQNELPPIVVRGARVGADAENRSMSAVGIVFTGDNLASNGEILDYRVSIPWQNWMEGSQLIFDGLNIGRGETTRVEIGLVADNLLLERETPAINYASVIPDAPVEQAEPPASAYQAPQSRPATGTIGDELSARFTFVESVANFNQARTSSALDAVFDYNMPLIFGTGTTHPDDETVNFIEMTRHGALHVKFERGSDVVARDLGENNQTLVDLISSIRILETSPDTRIVRVVVAGFSAPEGALDEKETLAMERAGVVRDFLTANSRIDPAVISIHNGSVDWTTLRALISDSNMPEKYKVLDIIDNVPAWGNPRNRGRLAQLMALNGGEDFLYMRENFFPKLRQTGAYVKVYYENVR
jgi:hypothetical protein